MEHKRILGVLPSLTPVATVLLTLLIRAVMLAILRANPSVAVRAFFVGAFGSTNALADTVVKATPLLFIKSGSESASLFVVGYRTLEGGQLITEVPRYYNNRFRPFHFVGLDIHPAFLFGEKFRYVYNKLQVHTIIPFATWEVICEA